MQIAKEKAKVWLLLAGVVKRIVIMPQTFYKRFTLYVVVVIAVLFAIFFLISKQKDKFHSSFSKQIEFFPSSLQSSPQSSPPQSQSSNSPDTPPIIKNNVTKLSTEKPVTVVTDTNDQSNIVASSLVSHQSCNCKTNNNDNTKVIIGGMSFIGSRLALLLHERKEKHLQVVEDIVSVDRDEMKWYRWTKLNAKGLQLNIRDYSEVKHILELQGPDSKLPIDIVYIPSLLFNSNEVKRSRLISALKNFVTFVNTVSKQFKINARMIMILPKKHTWNYVFQNALQSYFKTGTNCVCATILQIDRNLVYGPWQDTVVIKEFEKSGGTSLMVIDDVLKIIHNIMTTGENEKLDIITVGKEKIQELSHGWIQEYIDNRGNRTRNVALCGVLQDVSHTYHRSNTFFNINAANLFRYLQKWLVTATADGMETVVFCDIMSEGFQTRVSSSFKRAEFIKAKAVNDRSPNDQRFYMTYNYLLSHPDVKYATITDTRDVRFVTNPVTIMKGIGDYYFLGADLSFYLKPGDHGWMLQFGNACFPNSPLKERGYKLHGFINCGVLGGTRTMMLNLLSHMIVLFEKTDPKIICDMPVLEMLSHSEEFYDSIYYGYPFNTGFKGDIDGPKGVAIKHKDEE